MPVPASDERHALLRRSLRNVSKRQQKRGSGIAYVGSHVLRVVDRTVAKYYAFELTRSAHLAGPVWVLFLLSRGVSYTGIGLLDVAFSVTVLLAEVPTGYVSDRVGRRRALLLGTAGNVVGSVLFAFGRSLSTFLVAYVVLAVSRTFVSGSDSAWLYDVLQARTGEETFTRIRGRGQALGLVASGVAAVAGGLLGSVDLAWPWLASGAVVGLAVPVVATFPTPAEVGRQAEAETTTGDADDASETGDDELADDTEVVDTDGAAETGDDADALTVARDLLAGRLRWFVIYTGVFAAAMALVDFFVQPVTRDAVEGVSASLGVAVDPVVVLGVVYAAFTAVSAAVTANADRVRGAVGLAGYFRLAPPALGVVLAAVAVVPGAAVPAFFAMRAVRSLTEPLQGQYVNDRTPSVGRATTLSAVSMAHALIGAPFELLGGRLADLLGPATTVAVVGVGLAVVAVPLGAAQFGLDVGLAPRERD